MRAKSNYRRQGEVQALVLEILAELNQENVTYETVSHVLKRISNFFEFGCTFIYESDHTRTFHLKEHYTAYPNAVLHDKFLITDILSAEEIEQLRSSPNYFYNANRSSTAPAIGIAFSSFFLAKTLLLIPILDADRTIVGLTGIVDRRGDIQLSDSDIEVAHTIFSTLASHVKMRVYHQRNLYTSSTLVQIMNNTGIDIYVNDYDTHEILYLNESMAAPYGGIDNMIGRPCYEALYEDGRGECEFCPKKQLLDAEGNPSKIYSWDYKRPFDGSWFRVLSSVFPWVDGRMALVVSSIDITEGKESSLLVERLAFYDPLTGVPNRRKLEQDINTFIASATPEDTAVLVFLDLDDFKKINDKFGHEVGDAVLSKMGQHLQQEVGLNDNVYRYGGDEFIVFLPSSQFDIDTMLQSLAESFSNDWDIDGQPVTCRASIGVARYPENGSTYDSLLTSADRTMYKAKNSGKGHMEFSNEENASDI